MTNEILVLGTGMYGCLTAYKISKKFPKYKITIIDKSNKILKSFEPIKIAGLKMNNGHHLIENERNKNLNRFISSLKLKKKKIINNRGVLIENFLLQENSKISDYPNKIFSKKKFKIVNSNNIKKIYENLPYNFRSIINKVSSRYSTNKQETLSSFIPWFLPFEYNLYSSDEGDIYRNDLKYNSKISSGTIPDNGLIDSLRDPILKILKSRKNIEILLNTEVKIIKNNLFLKKNKTLVKKKFDHIFICSAPVSFLKEMKFKDFKKIFSNMRNFAITSVILKKNTKVTHNEILVMNTKIKELTRISKIYSDKLNKKFLLEFSFKNNDFKKFDVIKIKNNLETVFGKYNIKKINKLKFTRKTFKPNNLIIENAINFIKFNLKKKKISLLGKLVFFPINTCKAWDYSEINVKKLNEFSR